MENSTTIAWTSAPDNDKDYTKAWYPSLMVAFEIVSVLMILSNLLTIVAYAKTEQLQTPTNLLICNQSIIDGLMSFTAQAHLWLNYTQWGITKAMENRSICLLGLCLTRLTNVGSLVGILTLSIERSVAVFCPFRYYTLVTQMNIRKVIVVSRLSVFIFAIVPLLSHTTWEKGIRCISINIFARVHVYSLINIVFACLIFVAVLNISIAVLATKKNKVQDSISAVRSGHFKVMKMLLKVVGVYYLCRMPNLVMIIVFMITPIEERVDLPDWFLILYDFSKALIAVNCLFNPFIYARSNQQFRDAFKRIVGIN